MPEYLGSRARFIITLVSLSGIGLAGCAGIPQASHEPSPLSVTRLGASGLINKLLDVEPLEDSEELRPLRKKLGDAIVARRNAGLAQDISLYYRDLDAGLAIGIDDRERFSPASMLKVPLMISVLAQAAADESLLERRLPYETDPNTTPLLSTGTLVPGQEYSVDELIRAMIEISDNGAAQVLAKLTGWTAMEKVYTDLGLAVPWRRSPDQTMSVRESATFFRILYNASYLNRKMSEKALEYLAASEFSDGLAGGISVNTQIAHKFGERTAGDGRRELHDCGIVYYRPRPYILCVMTRGKDYRELEGVIRDLSRIVYTDISGPSSSVMASHR